jgi:hypothetical protein
MPTKRSSQPTKPAPTYTEWKARTAALLKRQGVVASVMRERDWRQLYIRGKAPEDAETSYWNTRPLFERMGKR